MHCTIACNMKLAMLLGRHIDRSAVMIRGVVLGVVLQACAMAQPPQVVWLSQSEISSDIAEALSDVVADGVGGVYGWGVVATGGDADVFALRLDMAGELLWTSELGTPADEAPTGAAPDGNGGVLVTGHTAGVLVDKMDEGMVDGFVARFDSDGTRSLLIQFGSESSDFPLAVAADGEGGFYVGGWTFGDIGGALIGGFDGFLVRMSQNGSILWAKKLGTSENDAVFGVAPDGTGGVVIVGHTTGDLAGVNVGGQDVFIARYDAGGTQLWIRQMGSPEDDQPNDVALSADGVVMVGSTEGDLADEHVGDWDVFVSRFDLAGNEGWTRQFGTSGEDWGASIAPRGDGGVVIGGRTSPGLWLADLAEGGDSDGFVTTLDAQGQQQEWGIRFATAPDDGVQGVDTDGSGRIFVGGRTNGVLGEAHEGNQDAFVASLGVRCEQDCNGDGRLDILDFVCFQARFAAGCP